jgi:hypothetical protein
MSIIPCECPLAGWCERHKLNKNEYLHKICKESDGHRANLDKLANKEELPSLLRRAANFVQATAQHVVTGMKNADDTLYKERISICEKCPLFDTQHRRCKECGCFMDIKARWLEQKCPQDKWPKMIE